MCVPFLMSIILTVLMQTISVYAQLSNRDEGVINYARNLNVSKLDTKLQKQPFEKWFRSLVGSRARIVWEVNDCGEQTGNPSYENSINPPICAEAQASGGGGREIYVSIIVGTHKAGIKGMPGIWNITMIDNSKALYPKSLREMKILSQRK